MNGGEQSAEVAEALKKQTKNRTLYERKTQRRRQRRRVKTQKTERTQQNEERGRDNI